MVDVLHNLMLPGEGWQEEHEVITLTVVPLLLEDLFQRCRTEGLK